MQKFLSRTFIKDYKNYSDPNVRFAYGKLSGIVGIITNVILFSVKIVTGLLIGSVSILADGINNLSDTASSVITLVGFKLSSRPADEDHPYGHQRVEYVTGLIISFIIFMVGALLMKSSIDKIIKPEDIEVTYPIIIILVLSILMKLWQSAFYRKSGKLINSKTLIATSRDSLNDTVATSAVLISFIITFFAGINLDGYMGVIVSVFIIISGIQLIKETISPLIGEAPSKEYIEEVTKEILTYPGVLGTHDMVIHSYGPAKTFMTVHVEVDSKVEINESHDVIDNIENDFKKNRNVDLVIHMDPIDTKCEVTIKLKNLTEEILKEIDPVLSFHDFRIVKGKTHTNMIFDVVIPINFKMNGDELKKLISLKAKENDPKLNVVITIDELYLG